MMWRHETLTIPGIISIVLLVSTGFGRSTEDDEYIAPLYSRSLQSHGKYIVKLHDDSDVEQIMLEVDNVLRTKSYAAGNSKIKRVFRNSIKAFAAELYQDEVETTINISIPPSEECQRALKSLIRRSRLVEYVEDDLPLIHFAVPIDRSLDELPWNLDRIDQRENEFDNKYEVDGDGSNVNVYVVDTGIAASHEEFGGRASVALDTFNEDGRDCSGHGTHCAGIIGGKRYGVAKGVNVLGIRTMDCYGSGTTSEAIEAFEWLMEHAQLPAVVSISLGTEDGDISLALDSVVEKVIDKGITVVAAAGNDAADACFTSPARGEKVITVGATTAHDGLASFSNRGPCVDILAPGVHIESTWLTKNQPTKILSGTSMACPHVAGAVAILLGRDPNLTPANVKEILLENATLNAISNSNTDCTDAFLYIP